MADLPSTAGQTGWPWTAESRRVEPSLAGNELPTICIVTPSFNQAEFLEATIRSVLLQGYPRLEYVIIDGGSIDGSQKVIRRYAPWLTAWCSEPDGGQYDAINRGFERTSGEIMAYLNSDDMLLPGALWAVGSLLAALPDVRWVTSRLPSVYDETGRWVECAPVPGYSRHRFGQGRYAAGQAGFIQHIQQESTFWRRSLWEDVGGRFDASLTYAGDLDLWCRFFERDELVAVSLPLGGNRAHATQKTSSLCAYADEAEAVLKLRCKSFQRFDGDTAPRLHWRVRRLAQKLGMLRSSPQPEGDMFHNAYYGAREGRWVVSCVPGHD